MKKKTLALYVLIMVLLCGMSAQASKDRMLSSNKLVMSKGQKVTLTLYQRSSGKYYSSIKGRKVHWKSSKTAVAAVGKTGIVKAGKNGTAVITARFGRKKYKCRVVVKTMQKVHITDVDYPYVGKLNKVSYKHVNGQKQTGYILDLKKPILLKLEDGSGVTLESIQVVLKDSKAKKYVGKDVLIQGETVEPMTAWYITRFALLSVKRIVAL